MLPRRATRLVICLNLLCAQGLVPEPNAAAAGPRAAGPGWFVAAPDGISTAERFDLDPAVVGLLTATGHEETVRLSDWPVAPGRRATVRLTRHDVYSADARVVVVGPGGEAAVPRSRLAFLWGEADDEAGARVLAIADPGARTLRAFVEGEDGWNELRPTDEAEGEYILAPSRALLGDDADRLTRECAEGALLTPKPGPTFGVHTPSFGTGEAAAATGLRQTTLAIDTDNELLLQKFSNNTTSATNYIASLVALISTVYERDLSLRVLQGTTFLRPSTAADPWLQSGTGSADGAKLDELRAYWSAHHASVSRAATLLLSGKQASAYASSGIGFVDALCSKTTGYAFVQVFKFSGSTASTDLLVSAHELGHVAGSHHTHCYLSPTPIDTCYAGEPGCYSGTTSCPAAQTINGVANVKGTLMSYCHVLSGCSSSTVFHPRTVSLLSPILDARTGSCVFAAGTPKEASPAGNLTVVRAAGGPGVTVTFSPACGSTNHTAYAGNLTTLASSGLAWSQRFCGLGVTGTATLDPGGAATYFVVVANNGSVEGSYGRSSTGAERPAAGAGAGCAFTQQLSGSCP
jgi:hypothetical protein